MELLLHENWISHPNRVLTGSLRFRPRRDEFFIDVAPHSRECVRRLPLIRDPESNSPQQPFRKLRIRGIAWKRTWTCPPPVVRLYLLFRVHIFAATRHGSAVGNFSSHLIADCFQLLRFRRARMGGWLLFIDHFG